jgi:hypothetical protein
VTPHREVEEIVPDYPDDAIEANRFDIASRRMDEVEQVEMADWVSGWLAVGSMGEPIAGYAHLSEGALGEVIASFTLPLAEGLSYCIATERFLRYDPARNSVDYIAHIIEFVPGWSLEGTSEVSEDFAAEFDESWPAVIFQHLIDAYPDFGVYPLSPEQAEEMAWPSHAEDQNAPPPDHLWRPIDLSAG